MLRHGLACGPPLADKPESSVNSIFDLDTEIKDKNGLTGGGFWGLIWLEPRFCRVWFGVLIAGIKRLPQKALVVNALWGLACDTRHKPGSCCDKHADTNQLQCV